MKLTMQARSSVRISGIDLATPNLTRVQETTSASAKNGVRPATLRHNWAMRLGARLRSLAASMRPYACASVQTGNL